MFMMFSMFPFRRLRGKGNDLPVPRRVPRPDARFAMPAEERPHEGTWLQWPHNHGWDPRHVERYEPTWIAMAKALHTGERVHIIVHDDREKGRVRALLREGAGLDMTRVDFHPFATDDVWVRDSGPIFVVDQNTGALCIANFTFNGWGRKAEHSHDNYVPLRVGHALNVPVVDVPMVHEGGSVEVDGRGTLMAKRSSVLNPNRNPGWTQRDAERFYGHLLGVINFIWLDGRKGDAKDITDDHIDGTARFANGNTIVTFHPEDFTNPKEYRILQKAKDVDGNRYRIVHLPCTTKKLEKLGDYGIYTNFYVGNEVVLVASFGDPNDPVAADQLQQLYPTRKVVGIPFEEVFCDGGLVHCVTQQQPEAQNQTGRGD